MQMQKTLVDYLFLRFSFVWDKKWEHKLKGAEEEKRRMWDVAISGLTRQQLNDAIDIATTKFDWPPEPRAFLECCAGKKKHTAPVNVEERYCDKNGAHYPYCAITDCRMPATVYSTRWICSQHWSDGK